MGEYLPENEFTPLHTSGVREEEKLGKQALLKPRKVLTPGPPAGYSWTGGLTARDPGVIAAAIGPIRRFKTDNIN